MQIISIGDNLHENPVFWENKKKKYVNMSSSENFTDSAKCYTQLTRKALKFANSHK